MDCNLKCLPTLSSIWRCTNAKEGKKQRRESVAQEDGRNRTTHAAGRAAPHIGEAAQGEGLTEGIYGLPLAASTHASILHPMLPPTRPEAGSLFRSSDSLQVCECQYRTKHFVSPSPIDSTTYHSNHNTTFTPWSSTKRASACMRYLDCGTFFNHIISRRGFWDSVGHCRLKWDHLTCFVVHRAARTLRGGISRVAHAYPHNLH